MFAKNCIVVLVGIACSVMASSTQAAKGPSSSQAPYVTAIAADIELTSILTAGDAANNGYRMSGIPDGLGVYDNNDDTMTVLMNHEMSSKDGVVRTHGTEGAYVSQWVINKQNLSVISGGDLIKKVYGWNAANQMSDSTTSIVTFSRFCSADLANPKAFFNLRSGLGSQARIFLNGEEGSNGYAVAHVSTGDSSGSSFILGKFNAATNGSGGYAIGNWENLLANPFPQDKTVVIGINDGGDGIMKNAVVVYVGNKTNTGSEVEKAGLTNGVIKFVSIAGFNREISDETNRTTGITSGTRFILSDTISTTFSRPEDGA